jgi:hypothetical protein
VVKPDFCCRTNRVKGFNVLKPDLCIKTMVSIMSPQLHLRHRRIIGVIIRVAIVAVFDLLVIAESRNIALKED